jgi:hypothetical protein
LAGGESSRSFQAECNQERRLIERTTGDLQNDYHLRLAAKAGGLQKDQAAWEGRLAIDPLKPNCGLNGPPPEKPGLKIETGGTRPKSDLNGPPVRHSSGFCLVHILIDKGVVDSIYSDSILFRPERVGLSSEGFSASPKAADPQQARRLRS